MDSFWSMYMFALGDTGEAPDVYDTHEFKYELYFLFFFITFFT